MKPSEKGLATAALAGILVVVLVVAALGFYLATSGKTSTPSSSSGSSSSSASSSSIATSSSSSVSTNSSGGACVGNGALLVNLADPNTALASSDVVVNYTITLTSVGTVPDTLALSAAGPQGVNLLVTPSEFTTASTTSPVLRVSVAKGTSAGNYPIVLKASGGGECYSSQLTLQVVNFLVVTIGEQYIPANLTVPAGSTVYWLRLNGAISQYDPGTHNIKFTNSGVTSISLEQYGSWSYTFAAAGSYPYYCTFHPTMTGVVTVSG